MNEGKLNNAPQDLSKADALIIANGYEPVLCNGKVPVMSGWQKGTVTAEYIAAKRAEYPEAINTGLRTGALVGVDIDIKNADHAAQMKALTFKTLGETPLVRVGAKGFMLCYSNATPIKKCMVAAKDGTKVEILGTGQQFIAYGIHPDTNQLYQWINIDDLGSLDPLNVSFSELPVVTPYQLRTFLHDAEALLKELSYSETKITNGLRETNEILSSNKGNPVTADHLRMLLGYISPDMPRDEWRDTVAAIRATPVLDDEDESERRQIAHEFSEGKLDRLGRYKEVLPSNYSDPFAVDQVFDTMPPKETGVGYGSIFRNAKVAGYDGPPSCLSSSQVFSSYLAKRSPSNSVGDNEQIDDETSKRCAQYRGVKPSEGAKRPKAIFWDTDRSFPRSPAGSRIIVYAKPSHHKTNFVLAKCLDAILEHGARVLFAAGEDADEFLTERIPAQCAARGISIESLDEKLLVAEVCPRLTDEAEVAAFIAEHKAFAPNIVVIDTLSEALTGQDENTAAVASTAMDQAGRIRKAFKAEVILVHHEGKNATKGARGSTVFGAGANAVWKISYDAERGIVTQYIEKLKRGKPKISFFWGTKIFDETMTVVRLDAVKASAIIKAAKAAASDANSALKEQVIAALWDAFKKDVPMLDSRQIAEHINRNAAVADQERLIENDIRQIQRKVKGTPKKPGILSDLVELDSRGDPISPYRFILSERYRTELEEEEDNE